ncbi:MAG: sugar transporter substrate-binding protein [Microbacteriaceae bacterium]|jgi:ribose transport system substrate-binding protein|nr:sugar transporter substrate-binding protein [Microbacteriaceae bacterium]
MNKTLAVITAGIVVALGATGCSSAATSSSVEDPKITAQVETALASLEGTINGTDPNGVTPSSFSDTELTDSEIAEIKSMGLSAGVAMHSMSDAWSVQLVAGLEEEFANLGIELVGVTDAENDPAKQTTQIESLLAASPDFIVSLPTDPVAMVDAFTKAKDAGVKLVFSTLVPNGFVGGEDYVSMVSDDRFTAGLVSGYQLAQAVGGKGKVGVVFHDADNFTTKQSYLGVLEALAEFPEITVVEQGVIGPDFAGDAQAAVNAMLTKNPDLAGAWGVWDLPAEGIMAAARSAGRDDLKITTIGFGPNVALALAKNDLVYGLSAIDSFSEGKAEARLGAAAMLGKANLPIYVASQPAQVNHDNVLESWETIYHEDAPKDLAAAYVK